jgi:hypothetical protein
VIITLNERGAKLKQQCEKGDNVKRLNRHKAAAKGWQTGAVAKRRRLDGEMDEEVDDQQKRGR